MSSGVEKQTIDKFKSEEVMLKIGMTRHKSSYLAIFVKKRSKGRRKIYRAIFFFSSRRRHTRYWRDWSSDVCSSDLIKNGPRVSRAKQHPKGLDHKERALQMAHSDSSAPPAHRTTRHHRCTEEFLDQIGRASCRERV